MVTSHNITVALGGNALSDPTGRGTITQQFARTRKTAAVLCDLLEAGHRLLITHGNGPQVGSILRRVELSQHEVYPIDLGLCVADSQAGMGYMIAQCMTNELLKRGINRYAVAIVTTVQVHPDDPAFAEPTKPIGAFYSQEQARRHCEQDGWNMAEIPNRGFRRLAPSPKPLAIKEIRQISRLHDDGELIIACGGGGVPVIWTQGWGYEGVEAVIDKDLCAALLAVGVNADLLVIVTDQDCIYERFGQPDQKPIDRLTASQARARLDAGDFPAGSMAPKVQAAVNFLSESGHPDARAIITSDTMLDQAIAGRAGTSIVRD
ncbi:MAG: carbamate kinase [Phycisphaerales bacterium]|nr:MAG: carbamate kinase [Phycisphaerales bacterium]